MNLADFLRQGPLAQQRMADASAFDRDSELANMMRQHGTVQDPNMVQEPSVLGNLPIDVPQPTEQDMQLGGEQIMGMMPMAGITAFHGSPHKFTKFDMSKIGTGEGAQAYGHGLYFAENPKVAKEYMRPEQNYQRATGHLNNRQEFVKDMMDLGRTKDDVWKMTQEKYGEFIDPSELSSDFKSIWAEPANLYKVDIPDDQIAKMLDWDKPLSEQPKEIMDAVDRALPQSKRDSLAKLGYLERDDYTKFNEGRTIAKQLGSMTGKDVEVGFGRDVRNSFGADADNYRRIAQDGDKTKNYQSVVAELLRQQGIPGIKYLDQGSRQGGKGTSNFVLFADDIAKILERNDQPIGELAEMLGSGKKVKP